MEHIALGKDFSTPVVFYPDTRNGTPADVVDDVRELWARREGGNDNCYICYSPIDKWKSDNYPALDKYLTDKGLAGGVLIHWWW